jgi:hypothetical protein
VDHCLLLLLVWFAHHLLVVPLLAACPYHTYSLPIVVTLLFIQVLSGNYDPLLLILSSISILVYHASICCP